MSAPELRFDVWTESWVIVAPDRRSVGSSRPGGLPAPASRCPFCPGHEADAEAATLEIGDPWRVRVVKNRYPIVLDEAAARSSREANIAAGAHEVVIESRNHAADLATLDPEAAIDVLSAWRERARALARTPGARAVVIFRNRGRRAGSSQPHPHSQIVALPFVPPFVARHAEVATRFRERHGDSLLTHALAEERRRGTGIVRDQSGIVTFCPFASSRAWLTRLAFDDGPKHLADLDDSRLVRLAPRLVDACRRALWASGAEDYNVLVREPPLDARDGGLVIDVVPRTGGDAGFELATGSGVCVVAPEEAAARMRASLALEP